MENSTVILQTWPPLQASALLLVIATLPFVLQNRTVMPDQETVSDVILQGNKRCHQATLYANY